MAPPQDHGRGLPEQVVVIEVAGLLMGLPLDRVVEVVRGLAPVPVPGAPAGVVGMVNLRGQVLGVLDPRLALGLPAPELPPDWVGVVVRTGGRRDCLVVERADEVLALAPGQWRSIPTSVPAQVRAGCLGLAQTRDDLLLALDLDHILAGHILAGPDRRGGEDDRPGD